MLRRIALPGLIAGLLITGLAQPAQAAPTWVTANALSPAGRTAVLPQVAVNAAGAAVAVWQVQDDAGDWRVQVSRRAPGGVWSPYTTISAAGASAIEAQVALDDHGLAIVVWARGDRIQERHAKTGRPWSAPVFLSSASHPASDAQVALDGHGVATAVWGVGTDTVNRIQSARRPAGGVWSAPVYLSRNPSTGAANDPRLAVNRAGTALAVWLKATAGGYVPQAARRSAGGAWSAPVGLGRSGEYADEAVIALNEAGAAVATWITSDGIDHWVAVASQSAAGTWGASRLLSASGQPASQPQVAIDSAGDAVAVWRRFDGSNFVIQKALRAVGTPWSPPSDLSEAGQDAFAPHVAMDPRGDAVATWGRNDGTRDLLQASRRPRGGTWSATETPFPTPDLYAVDHQQLAMDPQGNAVAVWASYNGVEEVIRPGALDAAGPGARITKPTVKTVNSKTFTVAWSVQDVWSAIASKDVRYRGKSANGTFGNWVNWKSGVTTASASFTGTAGHTYCFEARGTDTVGNVGAWSAKQCTKVSHT